MWEDIKQKSFIYPQKCCVCLGSPDAELEMVEKLSEGTVKTTYVYKVPICDKCLDRVKSFRVLAWLGAAIVFIGGVVLFFVFSEQDWLKNHTWRKLLFFIVAFLGLPYIVKMVIKKEPAETSTFESQKTKNVEGVEVPVMYKGPVFVNKEYQKLFEKANGMMLLMPYLGSSPK